MRFPGFTDEWKQYTIDEMANIYGRIGFRGYTTADLVEKGNGVISLSPSNIINNQLHTDKDNTYISFYKYEESPEIKIYEGDVIFVKTGSTVGKVAYVDKLDCKATLNPQLVVFKDIKCNKYLLGQILATSKIQKDISKITVGGAVPTLSQTELEKVRISLPEEQEQRKIASFLTLLDERIATQNKIIEDLKKLKSAIIDRIMDNSNYHRIRFEELYDKAGEGGTPSTSISEYYTEGTIPFVKIEDLSKKYLFDSKDHITELGLCKSSAWIIQTNSIIYSNGATIGAISINKIPVCTKQGILGIIPKKEFDVEYLYYFMSSTYFRKQVERIVTEGTMRTAYLKDMNHIECAIPDLEKQYSVSQILRSISNKLEVEQRLLNNYIQHKEYLLKSLFI